MFGAILSATDPVAVVALLKEVGASVRLSTLIEGESLLNDGTAMVIFQVMLELSNGEIFFRIDNIMHEFAFLSIGGCIVGLIFGFVLSFWISRVFNDRIMVISLSFFAAYMVFYVSEEVKVSGILALVSLGLYMSGFGYTQISSLDEEACHQFWKYIGYLAETLIFLLTGYIVGADILWEQTDIQAIDWFKMVGLYIMLHVIRGISICSLLYWLRKFGY